MIIIGTHFFAWGSDRAGHASQCAQCGTVTPFIIKKGMRFITLFFIIPLIPISGVKHMFQCPNCGTRYAATA